MPRKTTFPKQSTKLTATGSLKPKVDMAEYLRLIYEQDKMLKEIMGYGWFKVDTLIEVTEAELQVELNGESCFARHHALDLHVLPGLQPDKVVVVSALDQNTRDFDVMLLSNSVRASRSLHFGAEVPPQVSDDDSSGGSKIQSSAYKTQVSWIKLLTRLSRLTASFHGHQQDWSIFLALPLLDRFVIFVLGELAGGDRSLPAFGVAQSLQQVQLL